MKKIFFLLLFAFCFNAAASEPVSVYINNDKIIFESAPQVKNDRIFVPLRKAAEALGAEVLWENESGKITVRKDNSEFVMHIGSVNVLKNGEEQIKLEFPPFIEDNLTFVPLRFLAESFSMFVYWDEYNNASYIEPLLNEMRPEIDFSKDDNGNLAALHSEIRYYFENEILPRFILENSSKLVNYIKMSPDKFISEINSLWDDTAFYYALGYMAGSGGTNTFRSEEEFDKYIDGIKSMLGIRLEDVYYISYILLNDEIPCMLFEESEIPDNNSSSYLAVLYSQNSFKYYYLKSSGEEYYLYSGGFNEMSVNLGKCGNTKNEFIRALMRY